MRGFFVRKFCVKLFCACSKGLNFLLAQMRFKNVGEIDSRRMKKTGRLILENELNATSAYPYRETE
jgi:hypothetical protein